MILVTYPIIGDEQMVNHPDFQLLKQFDTTNYEDSKMVFMILLAQFGNLLCIYNMSSRSSNSYFENIDNLIDDINHQEVDFENSWCVLLNLCENDIRDIMSGYNRKFVIVDGNTLKPLMSGEEKKTDMIVYSNFESAINEMNGEKDMLYCFLSIKDPENADKYIVHIFSFKNNYVREVANYRASSDDKEWFEESYDELIKVVSPKKKMYIVQCQYGNGHHFEGDVYTILFEKEEDAKNQFNKEVANAEKEFNELFGEFRENKANGKTIIDFNEYEDWWEGKMFELEVN